MTVTNPGGPGGILFGGTRPNNGRFPGDMWFDSAATQSYYFWDGTSWHFEINEASATPLINGTQTALSVHTTNDGARHVAIIIGTVQVTTVETGGAIGLAYTQVSTAQTLSLDAGGHAATGLFPFSAQVIVDGNTNVQVQQTSALTAGAAVLVVGMRVI